MFRTSVTILTDELAGKLQSKHPELCQLVFSGKHPVDIDGEPKLYICTTCKREIGKGNLPQMSAANSLQVLPIDDKELHLSELENNLIAKRLLFQKIFQLPKSRMAACKDQLINIPINSEDVESTLQSIPRTAREAGLLEVRLKRKLEYQNVHKHAYIDPQKIYKALEFLRSNGHPDYTFYDDYNVYKRRCHMDNFTFVEDYQIEEIVDKDQYLKSLENSMNKECSEDDSDKEEEEYQKNDNIRKFQFDYDRSVCLVDKFPEAAVIEESVKESDQISFAPGEGKRPENILSSKSWDIQAFPMKHPDGKNNLHQKRERKISDQYYFVQRLRNKDPRFSNDPAYVFAAAAYLEKKQLQRNVNVSYQRGKEIQTPNGPSTFQLEDGFSVFGNIKNTPKYWKTAKYEMLSKLDNLGPFHFFFTLSCADNNWDENFSSILRKLGMTIVYSTNQDDEETTLVRTKEHGDVELRDYLKNHVDQSLHEMIRRHVFIATRNYNHRVKAFIRDIVTDKSNPMCVEYWTTKVEFQGRGAGHNHGTLWVDMKKMEFSFVDKDGMWGNLDDLLKSAVNKLDIKKELRHLLIKHFVKGETLDGQDTENLKSIHQQVFHTKNEDFIEETSDEFGMEFLNMFKLFGLSSAFKKFQTKEDLLKHEERAVIVFADKFTTCTLNESVIASKTNDKTLKSKASEVIEIVKRCNVHSHTRSCRKYSTECRYHFPRFPFWKTILSKPMKASGEEGKELRKKYDKVLKDVKEVLNDADVIKNVLEEYPKALDVTLDQYKQNRRKRILKLLSVAGLKEESDILLYEEALAASYAGYSIILERDIDEIFVNSYNPEWARAWKGNTDLQLCLDYFAVITYITEYYTKDDTGMMTKLVEMLKNSRSETLQDKMVMVMNTFITARQMGECEAFYKIIPDFHLKDSNVTTIFVPTSRKEFRSKFMIKVDDGVDYRGRELKKIEGRDGWYVEKYDLIDKYTRLDRKCDAIDELCTSQFLKMYATAHKMKESKGNSESDEDEEDEELDTDGYEKFNYVMKATGGRGPPLPEYIAIQDPFPGEPPFMRRRTKPAVLRFHKPKQSVDPDNYFFSEALLYTPYRTEEELEQRVKDAEHDGYKLLEEKIKAVKAQVMEHLESNQEARFMVEEANKKTEEMGENLDPQGEQDIEDCGQQDLSMHPDYEHLNPDNVDKVERTTHEKRYRPIEIDDIKELHDKTNNLDFYQRKVVQRGIEYSRRVVKARCNKNAHPSPVHVIVHGGAGAGKTAALNVLKQWCHLILQQPGDDPDCPYLVIAAPTGSAAANVRGQTMHSAFGFSFGNEHFSLSDKVRDIKRNLLQNLKIVIVDEISMVKSDQYFQLDKRMREVTQKPGKLFGGVSLFFFGDIMQLKPMGKYIFQEPSNPDFKLDFHVGQHWNSFEVINLEENHRQNEDQEYADLLNRFRIGRQTEKDMELLQTRVRPLNHPDLKDAVYISCKNKDVDKLNKMRLHEIVGEKVVLEAINTHPTIKNFKPPIGKTGNVNETPFLQTLELKKKARVKLTYNIDTLDCLTNGTRGEVVDFIRNAFGLVEKVLVKFDEPHQGRNKRESQPKLAELYPGSTSIERVLFQYSLSKRANNVSNCAKVIQFPLKLSFAATAHGFQGQTVYKPNKTVNNFKSIFGPAQGYVMMSRVETLDQLFVLDILPDNKFYASPHALKELERLERISVNKNPPAWEQDFSWCKKITLLNCRSLMKHIEDLRRDKIIAFSDIICLNETWLKNNNVEECLKLIGYELHLNSMGDGKGVGTYYKTATMIPETDITKPLTQISLLSSPELNVINLYRSQGMDNTELANDLKTLINEDKLTIICGDFNLCYVEQRNNEVTRVLEQAGFSQLVQEGTHFKGGHIDHIYAKHNPKQFKVDVSLYSPFYLSKDHDAICVTVTKASEHEQVV